MKERHILSTKEMAEIVYRHIQEGIIVLDAKGRVESFNPKAEAVTGYKQSEANGMEYAQTFYHPSLFKDIAGRLEEHADNWEGE
ncbi:MAG TPA: PAS domain S-box protein, partial [Chondromyces sp.]|nr:PAS domain S-box protein [Chondromyces sp.]